MSTFLIIFLFFAGVIAVGKVLIDVANEAEESKRQARLNEENEARQRAQARAAKEEKERLARLEAENRRKKQSADEFLSLSSKINLFQSDLSYLKSHYISHSMAQNFLADYSSLKDRLHKIRNDLQSDYCETASQIISSYNSFNIDYPRWNSAFLRNELIECNSLLNDINGHSLDAQQREAVITDEDHNLVIAGAGSGKTLTIAGKVRYLCERQGVNAKDILLIAFTKKAAEEMTGRIRDMGIDTEALTFHKLGLDIIGWYRAKKPDVFDNKSFDSFLTQYFSKAILTNDERMREIVDYFAYYLKVPSDMDNFKNLGEKYEHEKNNDFETMKSKFSDVHLNVGDKNSKITDKGEVVKSWEELYIADFLFLHGVRYEYEKPYEHDTADPYHRQYKPDFYLTDYDIYLEHFGINKNGRIPNRTPAEEKKYLAGMVWKRKIHQDYGTRLIETYSWYHQEGILFEKLEELLTDCGVAFSEPDYSEIYTKVYNSSDNRRLREFIRLCATFITLHKSNGFDIHDLSSLTYKSDRYKTEYHQRRAILFLSIISPIMEEYQKILDEKNAVDFSDMILSAAKAVNDGFSIHKYKYVIIDEFQDISSARYKLVKAILDATGAHLMCVGDDWQSVYRFSGSDLGIFTNFETMFGCSKILRIEKTYRNSQQLIDSAGRFITRNPNQIEKLLRSDKQLEMPLVFCYYEKDAIEMVCRIIDRLVDRFGSEKSLLFLGRTSYDEDVLLNSKLFKRNKFKGQDKLIYKKIPELDVSFMTVHKSKGLEADYVITLNFNNSLLGFPNKIADDPLLEMELSSSDSFLYGEERRLLYVAMTRTRMLTFFMINPNCPSEFVREFDEDPNVKRIYQVENSTMRIHCPICGSGVLKKRHNSKTGSEFVGCSNYPQCSFTLSDISVLTDPVYCSYCGGLMIRKHGPKGDFLGCVNYPECQHTLKITQEQHI